MPMSLRPPSRPGRPLRAMQCMGAQPLGSIPRRLFLSPSRRYFIEEHQLSRLLTGRQAPGRSRTGRYYTDSSGRFRRRTNISYQPCCTAATTLMGRPPHCLPPLEMRRAAISRSAAGTSFRQNVRYFGHTRPSVRLISSIDLILRLCFQPL